MIECIRKKIRCFYCKELIDNTEDFCRCCFAALAIDTCPYCCGSGEVRCHREKCHLKQMNDNDSYHCPPFYRDFCNQCSTECFDNGKKETKCMIEKNDMICGTCNGLLEDDRGHECECEKNRVISQAIHKQKHFENLKNDLLPIAWHPDRVYDWCFDEEEKGFLEGIWRVADEELLPIAWHHVKDDDKNV